MISETERRRRAAAEARRWFRTTLPTKNPRECDCVYCTTGPRRPDFVLVNAGR